MASRAAGGRGGDIAGEERPAALRIAGLTRRYGAYTAVDSLHLTIQPGEIHGFLGANGAGKTTTMKMLVGLLEPTAGSARIEGYDIREDSLDAKRSLGYVPDQSLIYERLSGREFLRLLARIHELPRAESDARIDELLGLLGMLDRANAPCGSYSFGMKRKLSLAAALLHRPALLVLDEPLNGLDPRSARRVKDLLADLAAQDRAVFLSTHDLATAESVCHRVGILERGKLVAEGSAEELRPWSSAPDLESVFLTLTAEAA